ncbi:MAG TPA: hypothetical protein VIN07_01200 [Flavipsychrobacter sp.]
MRCPEEISEFIRENKVATMCYVEEALPNCFNCLYACMPDGGGLIFKSSRSSLHSSAMQDNDAVAGTIYRSSESGLDNAGVQFRGRVAGDYTLRDAAEKTYYKRYPLALLIPGELFVVLFDNIKFTRTTKGIRQKNNWERAKN